MIVTPLDTIGGSLLVVVPLYVSCELPSPRKQIGAQSVRYGSELINAKIN